MGDKGIAQLLESPYPLLSLHPPSYTLFLVALTLIHGHVPLGTGLLNVEKGRLFEQAVILEIIRRTRSLGLHCKVHYWRTGGGAEVDCIIDTGDGLIPLEIKSGSRVARSELKGLRNFMDTYKEAREGFVITNGRAPEKLTDRITAIPWRFI